MRWLDLVRCWLWLGWRAFDPLRTAFQQELRRRGILAGVP